MTPSPADQLGSINSQIVQYIEVLLALGGVLALAYIGLRIVLPRLSGIRPAGPGPIEILSRYVLAPKHTLYLIKAGSQMFLIAASENGVTFLTAIAPDNVEEVLASRRVANTSSRDSGVMVWRQKSEKDR